MQLWIIENNTTMEIMLKKTKKRAHTFGSLPSHFGSGQPESVSPGSAGKAERKRSRDGGTMLCWQNGWSEEQGLRASSGWLAVTVDSLSFSLCLSFSVSLSRCQTLWVTSADTVHHCHFSPNSGQLGRQPWVTCFPRLYTYGLWCAYALSNTHACCVSATQRHTFMQPVTMFDLASCMHTYNFSVHLREID